MSPSDTGSGYGAKVTVVDGIFTPTTGDMYGYAASVVHYGTSGHVYGFYGDVYASDSTTAYGAYIRSYSSAGDTGNLYGIYSYVDNDTS